jgi:tRNA (cmo5U34)-methyltransferase
MQFLPIKSHTEYCQKIYDGLNKGGAFVLCEKTYQDTGYFQELFTFCHYDYKLDSFSPADILKKQTDLRRIMKPKTEKEIRKILLSVGFSEVSVFWQSFNFVGLIAIK